MATTTTIELTRVTQLALSVARRKGVPMETAADIAQEVVLAALTRVDAPHNWEAWVTTVAKNRAVDYHRDGVLLVDPASFATAAGERAAYHRGRYAMGPSAGATATIVLREALHVLNDRDRAILVGHAGGVPNAELADRFGLASAASAAVTVSRIKSRLRTRFPELAEQFGGRGSR